jgi:fructan beta-fructosidase
MGQPICSGSAVVDWNNTSGFGTANNPPMVAAYTDPCIDGIKAWQAQSIAYSLDKGRTWTKYSGNPVIDIRARGFRDPKVIWHEPTERWIAPMAYPDRGVVAIYASPNLREWTHISDFSPGGAECPDLFPMQLDGGGTTKWVMMVASGNYWVGEFDGTNFVPDNGTTPRGRLDNGSSYYAAQTFSGVPNGRRLLMAWMSDGFSRNGVWNSLPWQSNFTVVRELTLKTIDGVPQVLAEPAGELRRLHGKHYQLAGKAIASGSPVSLPAEAEGNQLDIEATLDPQSAAQSGLKVLVGSGQELVIGYDTAANQVYVERTGFAAIAGRGGAGGQDRGGAGGQAPGGGGRGAVAALRATLPDSARGKPVTLRVLVDRSAVEVFADGRARAMALRVFPIQTNSLAVPAKPGDRNLKLLGLGGLTVGGKIILISGPNGALGPVESLKVPSVGTAAMDATLLAPAAAGDTNIKVSTVANMTPDHALHGDVEQQADPTHTVSYLGALHQALRDLSAWVEKGVSPPPSTTYKVIDGQVQVPAAAGERKGIQPVLSVTANGGLRADVAAGQPVTFSAVIEVPPQTGRVVAAEWDFVGEGTFAVAGDVTGSLGARAVLKATHTFSKPGTCFPVLRAASHRQGDAKSPYARIQNLGRVRVIVR